MNKLNLPVFLDENTGGFNLLQQYFSRVNARVFVLADSNTNIHCLPFLQQSITVSKSFVVPAGEESKTLDTCLSLWNEFMKENISRNDVVIALGGGCLTDIAGFVCTVFKRGVRFVFMPTTLLGMTDAALGGKNGVDFHSFKNMLGTINEPEQVFIYTEFLKTLPKAEIRSGYAEMLKHALIANADLWNVLPDEFPLENCRIYLEQSAHIKLSIVNGDVYEKGGRKMLNYGHTVGHAIESWYLQQGRPILHGEAVAAGMCIEALLSVKSGLKEQDALSVVTRLKTIFKDAMHPIPSLDELLFYMKADKKNAEGELRFSLLAEIGEGLHDIPVTISELEVAFKIFSAL
jgi:3-dehydroquinate synthase